MKAQAKKRVVDELRELEMTARNLWQVSMRDMDNQWVTRHLYEMTQKLSRLVTLADIPKHDDKPRFAKSGPT